MQINLSDFDAVIVDLDGTMVDTLGDFVVALNRMLKDLDLPAVDRALVARLVGKGSEHLIKSVLTHVSVEEFAINRVAIDATNVDTKVQEGASDAGGATLYNATW